MRNQSAADFGLKTAIYSSTVKLRFENIRDLKANYDYIFLFSVPCGMKTHCSVYAFQRNFLRKTN